MTTNISVSTGHRAAVANIVAQRDSSSLDGNVERTTYNSEATATFIPPNTGGSFSISEGDSFQLQELSENIKTIDDLRAARPSAPAQAGEQADEAELAEPSPVQDGGYGEQAFQDVHAAEPDPLGEGEEYGIGAG